MRNTWATKRSTQWLIYFFFTMQTQIFDWELITMVREPISLGLWSRSIQIEYIKDIFRFGTRKNDIRYSTVKTTFLFYIPIWFCVSVLPMFLLTSSIWPLLQKEITERCKEGGSNSWLDILSNTVVKKNVL